MNGNGAQKDDCPDDDPCGEGPGEMPEGTALLPLIPKELGIHPLLLAVLHAVVFFDGSSEDVVHDGAANAALNYVATYLQRLEGNELRRVHEDMDVLIAYAKEQEWALEEVQFFREFLKDYGVRPVKS